VNLAKKLQGKTVEDLLAFEWLSVQKSVPGNNGELKLTEARNPALIDQIPDFLGSLIADEMVDLD
jgi:hypothetical protein